MKTIKEIRSEKPYYFVNIKGVSLFESEDIDRCKDFLINYIKENKKEMLEEDELYDYYIGMFTISID